LACPWLAMVSMLLSITSPSGFGNCVETRHDLIGDYALIEKAINKLMEAITRPNSRFYVQVDPTAFVNAGRPISTIHAASSVNPITTFMCGLYTRKFHNLIP
jgi:hypothetical protein